MNCEMSRIMSHRGATTSNTTLWQRLDMLVPINKHEICSTFVEARDPKWRETKIESVNDSQILRS